MGKFKAIKQIEQEMFDLVVRMMHYYTMRDKDAYKSHLVYLEELNGEYESLAGKKKLSPEQIIKYHERLWTF